MAAEYSVSDADVENIYRLLLAREPETRTVIEGSVGHPLAPVLASFMMSSEFKSNLALVQGRFVVNETLLTSLDPDLFAWVIAILKPGFVRNGEPVDRLTVIGHLVNDSAVSDAFDAGDIDRCGMDALKTALVQLGEVVRIVDGSALFDACYYRRQLPDGPRIADPAAHYVLHGEEAGLKPSSMFDAEVYAGLNADVAATGYNRLFHYEMWGRQEGRACNDWLAHHAMSAVAVDSGRPTILLLIHEATYTGAPILGWNVVRQLSARCDIVVVLLCGGALERALRDVASALVSAPPPEAILNPAEMDRFAERLAAVYKPLYVLANSLKSEPVAAALRRQDIPIVALIHEFLPGAGAGVRSDFYARCAALVFPARIVEESSFHAFREIGLQNRFILPQGPCAIPPFDRLFSPVRFGAPFTPGDDTSPASLDMLLRDGRRGAGPFTVIGLGAIEMRKGIDLFLSAATALRAKHPAIAFRFVWIGTWEHAIGTEYAALLVEQHHRSALGDRMRFFPAVDNLEPVYARADALFLSSRLDPLPNITIDAAFRGIPVVCFRPGLRGGRTAGCGPGDGGSRRSAPR